MPESLKTFSEQVAQELKAKLASEQTTEFIKQTKASGDDRSFEVVMSTADDDRQGDALDQSRWDLKYFEMNPVVLWAHDYSGFPIGIIDDISIQGDKAVATGKFAPQGMNPEADLACSLYQEKILRAVSPGYIQNDDGTRELLEVSFCPVPAGRYALSLRQIGRLHVSTQELITKGFFYEEKREKSPQVGDACELNDGTPGVLAEDSKNPGALICVPERDKSQNEPMKSDLEKQIKAEHERHGAVVGKAIDEFEKKAIATKAADDGADHSESDKTIDEFKDAIDGEQGTHLEKCTKAIDDTYETFGREENKSKSIDEFKSAVNAEHLNHVKVFHKAIDEFTKEWQDADAETGKKAIDTFEKKAADELSRHEQAHEDLLKDEMAEGEDDEKGIKGIVAAIVKSASGKSEWNEAELTEVLMKAGRAISAKNRDAIVKVIKAIDDHHAEHGKSTDEITAALKAVIAPGDGAEEPPADEKSAEAANSRSSTSGAKAELESYLLNQRFARQVKTAAEEVLRQINQKIREKYRSGR